MNTLHLHWVQPDFLRLPLDPRVRTSSGRYCSFQTNHSVTHTVGGAFLRFRPIVGRMVSEPTVLLDPWIIKSHTSYWTKPVLVFHSPAFQRSHCRSETDLLSILPYLSPFFSRCQDFLIEIAVGTETVGKHRTSRFFIGILSKFTVDRGT